MASFDVAVCGLGVMGCAIVRALAQRGLRAVGIERFTPGHDRGSSHGETRIIRLGYFEHPGYVPLVRRSYALWQEMERTAAQPLLHVTGIIEIGPPDGVLVRGTLASARAHGLAHEVLAAEEVMRRWPALRLPPDVVGVWQPDGGFLAVDACMRTLVAGAQAAGATLRTNERVQAIEPHGGGVRVATDRGVIDAGSAVVAAGPWLPALLPDLRASVRITRQVMAWFEPLDPALLAPGRLPVFLIESGHGMHYGFPPFDSTALKIAKHHHAEEAVDPDCCDRRVSATDEVLIRSSMADFLPAANGPLQTAKTCLYTMTPSGDFILDRLPGAPQIIAASPCSGHGFKFAPVIGEIVADLVVNGTTRHDIARFALDRL